MRSQQSLPLALLLSLAAVACDGGDAEELAIFHAPLTQINPQVSASTPTGLFEAVLHGDDNLLEISLEAIGLDAVSHPTFLYSGTSCPTQAMDDNDDGVVDVFEGQDAYGSILLPLDGDLTNQTIQAGTFPTGSSPSYAEDATLGLVVDAINGPEVNPLTLFVTLPAGEEFDLGRRVIVMHGVGAELLVARPLVAGIDGTGLSIPESVPILCGRVVLTEVQRDD